MFLMQYESIQNIFLEFEIPKNKKFNFSKCLVSGKHNDLEEVGVDTKINV